MKKTIQFLMLLMFANCTYAQLSNDCVNAINVCGNGVFTSNASGVGTVQEINSCGSSESNSIWLKVTIAPTSIAGGTLGFDIIPLNPDITVDYDFFVYGPNTTCSSLGASIRCCTTNPVAAGLVNNVTGLNGSSLQTSSGPGSYGNGYVRWLNTIAGETYYIAIDRPEGDGGFELHWTGTALLTAAPVANAINDFEVCSNTPDVGIFNLDSKRSQINSDLTNNTVNFFTTLANAVDNISSMPNIVANSSNPQLIYARVTDNATGCFSTIQFNLVVNSCMGIETLFNDFKVVAYPNPFENDFVIDIATANPEVLQIKVYDMLGKLVEQKVISPSKIATQKMGQKYASGVYNVIVSQDDIIKSFKILKE